MEWPLGAGHSCHRAGIGHWALGIGQWAMGVGHWAMDMRHWAMDMRHWAVGGGRWGIGALGRWGIGHWALGVGALGNGQWVFGHWALGHWAMGIGQLDSPPPAMSIATRALSARERDEPAAPTKTAAALMRMRPATPVSIVGHSLMHSPGSSEAPAVMKKIPSSMPSKGLMSAWVCAR